MIPGDPVAFLRSTPPFQALPQALFDEAARSIEVVAHPPGAVLVQAGAEPLQHLYVIGKGSVRLEREGQTLQVLEEGEVFGYTSLITGRATLDVVVEDELTAVRLPAAVFRTLLADARFAGHFAVGLSQRLRASLEHSPVAALQADLSRNVQQLVRREAVWVDPEATVGDAARVMRREGISSALVRTDPPGIVTDRDFRNRVLAEDLGPRTPVTAVFSRPLHVVQSTTPVYEAWRVLLERGIHHLPVARGDELVGVVTSTDLMRFTPHSPIAFLQRVERLSSRKDLPGYAAKTTEMVAALVAGGLDATLIGGFVARLNDVLVERILDWAEAELGKPPAPYAWIVFGSEGRQEQTLLTDQDNALVYGDEGAPRREWFQALADRVNEDLVAAGFPECPGGYMARSWHGTLSDWTTRFNGWIDVPSAQAMLVASIFFDFRKVRGDLDLEPLEAILSAARDKATFLRQFAASSMEYHPPPSFLLRLRGESSTVDLKPHGISPIVFLARCFGIEAGTRARATVDRLAAAVRAGHLDEEQFQGVVEAFRFVLGLRLRLQLASLRSGAPPVTKIALSELSAIERTRLKDALRTVESWHEASRHHFQVAT
jgi:CBS domain-containing protein